MTAKIGVMKAYLSVGMWICCVLLMMQHPRTDTLRISQYDDLIKVEAQKIGWDWRMLASIIYQESRFKPDLESSRGAYGLMQLMPTTMRKLGIDRNATVEEQLEAGGKLLLFLDRKLSSTITDSNERMYFVLACYNAGMSKVMKYRELALQHGRNPNVWSGNVERYCPKQTIAFVRDITNRYSYYKTIIE